MQSQAAAPAGAQAAGRAPTNGAARPGRGAAPAPGGRGYGRSGPGGPPAAIVVPAEDFDFASNLQKFNKPAAVTKQAPVSTYNKDDFFDQISSDVTEKSGGEERRRYDADRRVNRETFGVLDAGANSSINRPRPAAPGGRVRYLLVLCGCCPVCSLAFSRALHPVAAGRGLAVAAPVATAAGAAGAAVRRGAPLCLHRALLVLAGARSEVKCCVIHFAAAMHTSSRSRTAAAVALVLVAHRGLLKRNCGELLGELLNLVLERLKLRNVLRVNVRAEVLELVARLLLDLYCDLHGAVHKLCHL